MDRRTWRQIRQVQEMLNSPEARAAREHLNSPEARAAREHLNSAPWPLPGHPENHENGSVATAIFTPVRRPGWPAKT